ncbi:MAG: nickel pincer cofactor biosynthesis protein LarB [Blastochloris sp.]|jgi:NCAIR mutase (PurE)-related protein|nr:nickel pincer cofactor biosynthesis protein LarB [Blastochloris sp.]
MPKLRTKLPPHKKDPFAHVDLERLARCGASEVIFGLGKTPEQILAIAQILKNADQSVLITRTNVTVWKKLKPHFPGARFDLSAHLISWRNPRSAPTAKPLHILVCAAGTSDLPVAEEAALTAEFYGNKVERLYDVGVAGLHRLLKHLEKLRSCHAIIAVAGMEGALPSVIGGLVACPVIAVPTSIGYGANLQGVAALLGMLTSCASGLTVVNIDNGFGAAMAVERLKFSPS